MDGYEISTKVFVTIAGIPLAAISRGYVLSVMWTWFVVPVFHLPLLTIPYALGIGLLMTSLAGASSNKREESLFSSIATMVLTPWFLLLVAWIVKLFV
jgi:hypothetical protein